MMLRIAPELVADYQALEAVEFGNAFEPACRAWVTQDRTKPGHIGDPRHASVEKGEILCRAFAADVVSLLERVLAWQGKSWNG
jgi:creatinine amidohydrolase